MSKPLTIYLSRITSILALIGTCSTAISQVLNAGLPKIVMTFTNNGTRVETANLYGEYVRHIQNCAKVDVTNLDGVSLVENMQRVDLLNETQILEAVKSKKAQIAHANAGIVPVAYSTGHIDTLAGHGSSKTKKLASYHLILITRVDSAAKQPSDLQGKKIAHTTPGSNSGNLAPRAYFPKLGLAPDKDYQVVFSKGHERSVVGVLHGFYDAAAVASDQFERMIAREEIRSSMFRVLWKSEAFPTSSFLMQKDLNPLLAKKIRECTFSYKIPASTSQLIGGADRYLPINYEQDYAPVRFVLDSAALTKQ